MKKLKQSTSTILPIAKLFFDDLEQIDKILKESGSSYTITIDEYELDSINEIKEIEDKQDFYKLEVSLSKPFFSLNIDEYVTHIYSSDDNSLCIGIIEKIKPIIKKRRKILYYFTFFEWIFPLILACLNYFLANYHKDIYPDLVEYVSLGIIILWYIKIFVFRNPKKNIVFTTKKSNEPSNYFIKNKDQIISNSISAVIGGIAVTLFRFILTGQ